MSEQDRHEVNVLAYAEAATKRAVQAEQQVQAAQAEAAVAQQQIDRLAEFLMERFPHEIGPEGGA